MELFLTLFVLGVLFTLSIYFEWFPINTRYVFLTLLSFGILYSYFNLNLNFADFGITSPTFDSSIPYIIITATALVLIRRYDISKKINLHKVGNSKLLNSGYFYLFFSVPLQELLTRSYPRAVFVQLGWNSILLFSTFSAFVFAFSHLFLKNTLLIRLSFCMGLVWGTIFYLWPDFISLCLSHLVLGVKFTRNEESKR